MTRAGTAGGTWRSVVRTGALWGAGAVFLALVGLVEAVSRRQIVAGVLSLSYTFILLAGFGSGVRAWRHGSDSRAAQRPAHSRGCWWGCLWSSAAWPIFAPC